MNPGIAYIPVGDDAALALIGLLRELGYDAIALRIQRARDMPTQERLLYLDQLVDFMCDLRRTALARAIEHVLLAYEKPPPTPPTPPTTTNERWIINEMRCRVANGADSNGHLEGLLAIYDAR